MSRGAYVAFCANTDKTLPVNLQNAMKYGITVKCIRESSEFISTAINVLANKAVEFSQIPFHTYGEEELPTVLSERAALVESGAFLPVGVTVFKFVF